MRMTRAALRAQESGETLREQINAQLESQTEPSLQNEIVIHEDTDKETSMVSESEAKSLDFEQSDREALKDITGEQYLAVQMAEEQPKRTMSKKGKKATGKAGKDRQQMQAEESSSSSCEIVEQINSDGDKGNIFASQPVSVNIKPKVENETSGSTGVFDESPKQNQTSYSPGAVSPSESINPSAECLSPRGKIASILRTPRFDPNKHTRISPISTNSGSENNDSFVEAIKSRTPSKHSSPNNQSNDSFIMNIASRTPARTTSSPRVEDSVAALDALEDAIEKIAGDLPSLEPASVASPSRKQTSSAKSALKITVKPRPKSLQKPLSPSKAKMTVGDSRSIAGRLSVKDRIKAFETKPPGPSHRRAASVITTKSVTIAPVKVSKKPSHAPSKSVVIPPSKPMISPTQSPTKPQQNMVKKRVPSGPLSTSRPGFVPTKSSKPLTKSAFVLPGDAIAAKLKAQREERLKKEEEANKKKEFRARPAPSMTAGPSVMPRENKASQARMKRLSGEDKENVAPAKSTASKATVTATKTRTAVNQPNSSVRRTSPSASTPNDATKARTANMRITSSDSTRSVSSNPSQQANTKSVPKGKEAFDRQRMTVTDAHREKREKEDAAKKARAEAAERGRQASRDWAEKQKRKVMAEREAKAKIEVQAVAV